MVSQDDAGPNARRVGLFVGILAVSAIALLASAAVAGTSPITLAPAYMFSPMIAGAIICRLEGIPLSDVGLRVGRPRWLPIAAVLALPLVGLTLVIAVAVPGVGFDPSIDPVPGIELPPGIAGVLASFGLILSLGATMNAIFAFGEEFGWRGYLLWELAPWGFWKASVAIGTLWGVWHAPVILAGYNYPSFPIVGVAAMTVACVAFSPVYTYLVVKAESVFVAAMLHGVFNGSAGLVVAYAVTDRPVLAELVASPVGAAGVLAFGVAAVAIAIAGTPSLTRAFAGSVETTPSTD